MTVYTFTGFQSSGNNFYDLDGDSCTFLGLSHAATSSFLVQGGGSIAFYQGSNPGAASITNVSGTISLHNGVSASDAYIDNLSEFDLFDTSEAGRATIVNSGSLNFRDYSAAGAYASGTTVIYGYAGGTINFLDHSYVASAKINNYSVLTFSGYSYTYGTNIRNYGSVVFKDNSAIHAAEISNFGTVDFSSTAGAVGHGEIDAVSLSGSGVYLVGNSDIEFGSNQTANLIGGIFKQNIAGDAAKINITEATTVEPLTVGGGVRIRDMSAVTQSGDVTLGDSSNQAARLAVAQGATWVINGNYQILSNSAHALVNIGGGYLAKIGGDATSRIAPDITNLSPATGSIRAKVGTLELGGNLSGSLNLVVNGGAKLILDKAASPGTTINFKGSGGTVQLNDAQDFHGAIGGFGAGQALDLASILKDSSHSTTLAYSGSGSSGTLIVSDGTHAAALSLAGGFAAGSFHLANDNQGGSLITYG